MFEPAVAPGPVHGGEVGLVDPLGVLPDVAAPGDGVGELKVASEADVIDAYEVRGVVHLVHEVVGDGGLPGLLGEERCDAYHAALLCARLDGFIRLRPLEAVPPEVAPHVHPRHPAGVAAHLPGRSLT